ncbi:MAG: VOC family protein [Luteolibacter sp.]
MGMLSKLVTPPNPELANTLEPCRIARMIRFLHTRIRVLDMDRSIAFYQTLGYQLREKKASPQGNELAFLELPGNEVFLELCYSPDYHTRCPEDLMHTALGVPDIVGYCDKLEKNGIEIWPSNWRDSFSNGGRKMAFVTDPDGYEVEILER